jgi:hypothetical protein
LSFLKKVMVEFGFILDVAVVIIVDEKEEWE